MTDAKSVRERIERDEFFFDNALVTHGYAPHMRDYDVIIEVLASLPDNSGSYVAERVRYRFTHCVEATTRTTVSPEIWRRSWDDVLINYDAWLAAGEPDGYVWGVEWSAAYPGLTYVDPSERAATWTEQVGREMHELSIETNAFAINLVCHDFIIDQLAEFSPDEPPSR